MTTNPNWPVTVTSVAFNAGPFDATTTTTQYVDLSTRTRSLNSSMGRQYELDQITAGEAHLVIDDKDEVLNPTNPASPYFPNVKPYRQISDQAMWPTAAYTNGVNANLLNPNTGYLPYNSDPIDPSFEVYLVGSAWGRSTGPSLATIFSSPI